MAMQDMIVPRQMQMQHLQPQGLLLQARFSPHHPGISSSGSSSWAPLLDWLPFTQ
jgi:hypothetical protein